MSFNPERGERGDRKRRREPSAIDSLRIPPHSIEAEQAVLGGLMLSPDSLDKVADKLTDDDFYRRDHRMIWRAINELANKGMPCDAITLGDWFVANEMAEMVGGATYLMELANSTPSAANIAAYGDIVREKSVMRQLIDAGTAITEDGFRPEGKSVQEVMELAEQRVFRIAESGARGKKDIVSVREAAGEAFRMLSERYEKRGQLTGLSTGFTDLDELTSGLQPSDLVIIAARPSMGKTAFALNLAEAAAMRGKKSVAVFSMEMSASQLAFRLISSLGRVHAQHLRNGDLAEEDWPRVTSAITMLADAKIFIDDTPAMSPVEMRSRSRRLQREHGLGLIVIDYLQLMQVPGNSENRATEISEISRGLKALAKELNVPVIALSQLNRSLEQRADKRPMMSDLRESGAIEQDADVIMFIYRDEYYNKESPDKGLAEIIIGKQRNGPTDTVKLAFLGHYTKFENWAPDSYVGTFD
ncbi:MULTISPECIES: replicative DNA helicase [unclassified Luteibacter]|uniref:replicative DNA helicase n=1 Tax=unclassified Luteibacter TaxID=2620188 RepID=UPI0008C2330D|nr:MULTISPECIES: replicative DNA helicase [unclassified Luteibacter]MDR6936364.1 replicative DNA helicase [Luteibacter sp. 3190]SEO60637.1 replicative DNA helicase [Luteibacter sp. UNC138MFCol5.1]SEV86161.1 primary replicative DNA helicase [Luteibacter sp. 329MFSha]